MRYKYSQKRAMEQYRLDVYRGVRERGVYGIPVLAPYRGDVECRDLVAFSEARRTGDLSEFGVHFFLDDYRFERVWNDPRRYALELSGAHFVLTPDFSLYTDMPLCQQIYNTYRNRLVGACFQKFGLTVVPTIGWGDERSYGFCFAGVPEGNVCAVSNVGCFGDARVRDLWHRGFDEMVRRIRPCKIIVYGNRIDGSLGNIAYFCDGNLKRMSSYGR